MPDLKRCETVREIDGSRCVSQPEFIVGVGDRTIDEQTSCARHLAAACRAFVGSDGARARVRVSLITRWARDLPSGV